jgi:hypothetical protein
VTVTSSGNWLYLESFVSANAANFNEDAYTTTSPCDVLSSANKPCVITVHWQGGPQPPGGESLFVDYATCNGSVDSNTNLCAGPDFSDWDLKTGFGVEQIVAHVGSTNSPVSPSPSYSWQENNDWDSCTAGTMGFWAYTAWSPTCGTSTQTRSAACPGTSVGTQTQTVSCVLTDGSSATPSLCDPSTLPTTTRTCTLSTSSCGPLGSTSQSVTFNSCQPPPGSGTPSSGGTPSCTSNPATQVFCIIVPLI